MNLNYGPNEMTYDEWFMSKQWIPYNGAYVFAQDAWNYQGETIADLRIQLAKREKQLAKAQMYALGKKLLLEEREKQIVMLRVLIAALHKGGVMGFDRDGMRLCAEALDATQDLKDCILCEAEPRAYLYRHNSAFGDGNFWSHRPLHNGKDAIESLPLYKGRRMK